MFMTRMNKVLVLTLVLIAAGTNSAAADNLESPMLGHEATAAEIAAWDTSVFPDGEGLPKGKGSVAEGEIVYQQQCLACHGENGLGTQLGDQLAGAQMSLTSDYPEQTIGSYWPYATTVFDIVRRSMPMTAPGSLTNNEVYAVTAYLLYLNQLVDKEAVMDQASLPKVKMPNENGFINVYEAEMAQ